MPDNVEKIPLKKSEQDVKADSRNRRAMRAIVLGVQKQAKDLAASDDVDNSKQIEYDDAWQTLSGSYIEPPYPLLVLAMLRENNSILGQCIDAMEVNIDSFGHRFVAKPWNANFRDDAIRKEIAREKITLANFFNNVAIGQPSFTKLRRLTRKDIEATGNGFWEIIYTASQKIAGFKWAPAHTMRLCTMDSESTAVTVPRLSVNEDTGAPEYKDVIYHNRFRKYVQVREGKTVYFKEFGDPRMMNSVTGEYVKDADIPNLPLDKRANAVFHFCISASRTPYGIPRYIGNLFSIYGSRASEEINFVTLKNNNIPSLLMMVSGGGMLTDASIRRLEEFVESNIKGSDNYSKILLVEAEPIEEGALPGQSSDIKLHIEKLTSEQVKDAMFQDYDKNNKAKVRGSFRLAPIFVGEAEDYSRATAETSKKVTDEQVFAPERNEFDDLINTVFMPLLGIKWHSFKSNSPNTTDNKDLIQMMATSEKTGGLTPRIARQLMSDVFGDDLGDVVNINPDVPFTLQVAEAVKNTAPVNMGTLTAIKNSDQSALTGVDVVKALVTLRAEILKAIGEQEDHGE